ncbi:relaxase/mobilization nuclease domain-containing protein (plasmid) [Cyanobacterium sp. IPPAS B-1200]|uniref:relaxase/mobilization nuclease domain-containing protein n=1 Tax=Cyanobacterium sp. IPPAS B-1200 TaxID=1562720 RepID=UPI00085285C3|nr:relaxase/mobilization nuclease domain-containing protein [Cyanobacterium sp. IPPAS B-1200]OEJ78413.1 hypothetical protein A5482_13270 [Cyanobacterium sp. IPPAS B-1200]
MPLARQINGSNFRQCIGYILDREEKEILESNLYGESALSLSKKFEYCCQLNRHVRKPVYHVTLSFPEEEQSIDDEMLKAISHDYLYGMGFGEKQPDLDALEEHKPQKTGDKKLFEDQSLAVPYLVVRHDDTDHKHIHIVAGRVRNDSSCVYIYWDYRKSEKLLRILEDYHGLSSPKSTETLRELRNKIDKGRDECKDFAELEKLLQEEGVNIYRKKTGVIYGYDGKHYKGGTLGAKYTMQGLSKVLDKKGLDEYETTTDEFDFNHDFIKTLEQHRDTMEQVLKYANSDSHDGNYYRIERSKKNLVISRIDNPDEMIKWIKPAPNKPWILNNFRFNKDTYDDFEKRVRQSKQVMEETEKELLAVQEQKRMVQKKVEHQVQSPEQQKPTISRGRRR